jgi:FlaA1/EpsC-like NDP-sugar epimerase
MARTGSATVVRSVIRYRRFIVIITQLALVALSNVVALWLKFGDSAIVDATSIHRSFFLATLPLLVVIRGLAFAPLRLYEGLWRYSSIWELRNIILGVFASSVVFEVVVRLASGHNYPRSVLIIDSVLLVCALGGLRLARRLYRALGYLGRAKRVLIYGAGDAGEMIVRDMRNNRDYEYEPIGFVDDDRRKVGQRIHGVRVLGTSDALPVIIQREAPDAILVAIPSASPTTVRTIVRVLEPYKVPIQTLPSLRGVMGGRATTQQVRALSVEDLLDREPFGVDTTLASRLIRGRRVLVTGAGGSIGSELSRQIATLSPAALVLLDRYENGLHGLHLELTEREGRCPTAAVIGDVCDADRMNSVMNEYRPEIVFHAAAHKHVPLMEANPCEAVKNNVRGTRILAEAAVACGVERFILISTDKAVNPASVMGASKRVAELLVSNGGQRGGAIFAVVRFGNVLASNGSVVPRFLEQIQAGGPVTVTHPDVRRYFMLIPEAVHLMLQAAALASGGDIFVLEMGEQVRVLDLARNLIRLSGRVPDDEISIVFAGLRPGEKLREELVAEDESIEAPSSAGVLRVVARSAPDWLTLQRGVIELERLAAEDDAPAVIKALTELVPTYCPAGGGA